MHLSKVNQISLAALFLLGGGLFMTLGLSQQTQETRTRAAEIQTITLKPVADVTASSNSPSENSGSSLKLGVDGDSPIKVSYLKYDLSALAGKTVTGVVFKFRTAPDPGQTNNTQYVRVVDNTSWTESGVTYYNKPVISTTTLASISPRSTNQWYSYPLTIAPVQLKAGGLFAMAVQAPSSSTDYLEMRSRENAGYEPQLIITYTASNSTNTAATATLPPTAIPTVMPTTLPTTVPTALPTQIPSATPTPFQIGSTVSPTSPVTTATPTTVATGTQVNLNLLLHGIGKGGDSVNPNSQGNFSPLRPGRTVSVDIFDVQNQLVGSKIGTVTFNAASGSFIGNVNLGSTFATGLYTMKVKTDQYLRDLVPGIQTITANTVNTLPSVTLVTGDVNNDNQINIVDYNIVVGCYSDLLPPISCTTSNAVLTDFNDDGKTNQIDYNLFLRELTNIGGE